MGIAGYICPLLILLLLSCGLPSEKPDSAGTPEVPGHRQAPTIVDELARVEVTPWTDRVWGLGEPLRFAVIRELGRRAITVGEELTQTPEKWPKEIEAIKNLLKRSLGVADPFVDFVVWASAHQGHEGLFNIWGIGERAFPSVLKLRKDRHFYIHMMVGGIFVEYVLGSHRGKSSTDAKIGEFCRKELARCPSELRPHYHAILAAIGDESALDSFPVLLKSDTVADWQYALQFLEAMFRRDCPYEKREIHSSNSDYRSAEEGTRIWKPLTTVAHEWWLKHRGQMIYDKETGIWRIGKK